MEFIGCWYQKLVRLLGLGMSFLRKGLDIVHSAEGEYFADNEDNIDLNYKFLTENSFVHTSQTPTKTPAETAETPAKTTQVEKSKISCPQIIYPPASHKSAHIQGSTGTMDTIPIIEQDDDHNENEMALAINIPLEPLNRFVPLTFREAFDIT
jgi:hypothetical protein